ncbi:intein-containing Fe-S cluster assembly protein SufB [Mycobacterium xenopi]|uniref:DOD-type homing endonuclease domain-containing protein n=2 Tax=Mycobacterium xenopi TaxID=1789 RepID=A0AAD1M1P1_MYCXE|nr:intein-containing Fe-S cluster assembly protein SufB [Mycobacterium xenopi]EUA34954.1 feS assembly protein SufB [Mycobacterium xenopi 3993]MDA3638025.1 intein-containing Fe-S cluster assembly protein SufB [Mycobacterium xenopi]MDA3656094.1 intein-containing Fe-S cluster assembly protein SufB [Mycobacterium xenopi]MDA3660587.1 intein-containing Fe-S cluster assembly protein SufB [Mycobacterium xenopi]SPX88730.1 Putative enzyme [Mycobacterium xenopi]
MTTTPEVRKLDEPLTQQEAIAALGRYGYGWADSDIAGASARRGLSEEVVRDISAKKNEPRWMLENRLKALRIFERKPIPTWGSDLSGIDFDNIKYFVRSTEKQAATWDDLPADIRNTYDKLGIPEAEKQRLIAGVAAQYECLAGDTLVWTANRGQVAIKDIEFGDRVFAYDEDAGRFVVAPVKAAAQTDTRLTHEVKTTGRSIRATDNHPVLVSRDERTGDRQRARYVRRWVTVGDIQPGDFIAVPRRLPEFGVAAELPSAAGLRTPAVSSVDLMWLLGFYIGAGNLHLSTKTYRVQFAIAATDAALRAELARVVDELFGLRCVEAGEYRAVVNSKALTDWIVELGFGGLSLTKRVPDWVYSLPRDQRLAFLGGWVDADGHVGPDHSGSVLLTCGNEALLEQARELAELCGLRAGGPWAFTQPYDHDRSRTQIAWRLSISGDFEHLGCRNPKHTSGLGRRRNMHSPNDEHGTAVRVHGNEWLGFERVESVEPYAVEPVYDIEVDGPHNFVAAGLVVHNSEVVYHKIREDLESQGVIFLDTDTGLREHEDIFKQYFGTVIPAGDNKFAALNTAVWSGGSFIYVPPGVHVEIPLQAYFRINTENMGQFERTLIIVDENAYVHYVEGCTAPIYKSDSLHSAVVEIIVKPHGRCRYTTIQNWSNNVYNLVTKRARAEEGATMEWIDGNIGSKVTMKYPAVWMTGEHAKGEVLSVAFAGEGQHQDAGAKMLHLAPNTSSTIVSKSVARGGGRTSYRGLVQVNKGAHGSRSSVKCDALLVDTVSRSDTYPYVDIREDDVTMGHEATVSKVSENQLFYLMSRGLTEDEAMAMIVRGFVEPIAKELPMEYALELNRLIELQMEGAVG